jgi:Kef-type K+ transport system membrane component KefB
VKSAVSISLSGIVVPLGIGVVVAIGVRSELAPKTVAPSLFVAFMAVAMSVTAFPVLARIVSERNLRETPVGVMAITCAAAGDIVAWCMLAVLVGMARGSQTSGGITVALAAAYVVAMYFGARPWLVRLAERVERSGEVPRHAVSRILLGVLLSGLATEWIGIHALFGAFLLGAMIPSSSLLGRALACERSSRRLPAAPGGSSPGSSSSQRS